MLLPDNISVLMLLFSVLVGYALGVVSGLIPGIHTNNFALILVAISPLMTDYGISPFYAAIIILSNSITHSFHDIIPAVFLGVPDGDTALAVLPGHRLLLDGRASEAIRLSAIGSAGSVICSLFLALPLATTFGRVYPFIQPHMGWLLLLVVFVMIMTEKGEYVIGQGSLVPYKYKAYALILFFLSGTLGLFAFRMEYLMDPFIGLISPSILLPLLSGLFGASQLLLSLLSRPNIPLQENSEMLFHRNRVIRGIVTGSIAGSVVAWLPGISSSIATVIARLFIKSDFESQEVPLAEEDDDHMDASKEFIISLSGVNTSNAIFGLFALATIGKARSGAMVGVNELIGSDLGLSTILLFLFVIISSAFLSYLSTIAIGSNIHTVLSKIDYHRLSIAVLIGLSLLVLGFTGFFGMIVFLLAIPVGMLASFMKVRRSNAMGVILLPVILYFI